MLTVEFIEVPPDGWPIGKVLYERSFGLMIDARAFVPNVGDHVKLPYPHRVRRCQRVVWKHGKKKTTIQVHLRNFRG